MARDWLDLTPYRIAAMILPHVTGLDTVCLGTGSRGGDKTTQQEVTLVEHSVNMLILYTPDLLPGNTLILASLKVRRRLKTLHLLIYF